MNTGTFYSRIGNGIADYLWQELHIRPNIHYRIKSSEEGPRVLSLFVIISPSYLKKISSITEQLSMAAGLGRDISIRVERGVGGMLIVEIPKPRELWFDIAVSSLPRRKGLRPVVGLDIERRPAFIDFTHPTSPHCLIAGSTGSGKTMAGQVLIYHLAQNEVNDVRMLLIDTRKRGSGWSSFARLPHLMHPIIIDEETALRTLGWAVAEIDRRSVEGRNTPRIFIGIDEVQALLELEQFVRPIAELAAVGREYGLHVLLLTQNPTARQLGDVNIKRNLNCRLVGKVDSGIAALAATGLPDSGAEMLVGAGDMLLVTPEGMRRITTPLLTTRDTFSLPKTEQVIALDLDPYEDIDHILEVGKTTGRYPDPVEPKHVYHALIEPDITSNELYRRFSIRRSKAKAVKDFAKAILTLMDRDGYYLCRETETAGRNGTS